MRDVRTLGKSQVTEPLEAFILDVSHYIQIIRPKDFYIFREDFDPNTYYITSGDAIKKTTVLIHDLERYKNHIAEYVNVFSTYTEVELDFISVLDVAIESAHKMLDDLKIAKGDNCFLETEWGENHNLFVLGKNPRAR